LKKEINATIFRYGTSYFSLWQKRKKMVKVSYEHNFFKEREHRNLMLIGKDKMMAAASMFQVSYFSEYQSHDSNFCSTGFR
jgi:hypothetical protein